jgi:Leucine-rich repeat (LRR) protein
LPKTLKYLYCHKNPLLTHLPELPEILTTLDCSNNPLLTFLPDLPETLTELDCSNCPLLNEIYPFELTIENIRKYQNESYRSYIFK